MENRYLKQKAQDRMAHFTMHLVGLQVPIPTIPAIGVGVLEG